MLVKAYLQYARARNRVNQTEDGTYQYELALASEREAYDSYFKMMRERLVALI